MHDLHNTLLIKNCMEALLHANYVIVRGISGEKKQKNHQSIGLVSPVLLSHLVSCIHDVGDNEKHESTD